MAATKLAIIGNQAIAMRNFRGPLIVALVTAGVEVFALAPDYTDGDRRAIEGLGARPVDYRMRRTEVNPVRDLWGMAQLVGLLGGIRPDSVLSFAVKPVIYGTLAAWVARVPRRFALIEGLGHVFINEPGLRSGALRWVVSMLYRLALTVAARALFLNDDDRAEFVAARLVSAVKAVTVGAIGIDLVAWAVAPPVSSPLTFIFVGRLLREKGIFEFIEAARAIKAAHPNVGFVVLGSPDSNPSSVRAERVRGWVDEGLVTWPGHVDVRPWLARSSVFVLPSYREGMPRSTQEAMALGKPVITTDVPGCRDTVVDGGNGFLVPSKDASALQAAMLRFVVDRGLIAKMGERSRQMAEASFDVNAANVRMMNVLCPR
jgi:glycosyltransferase involved in cell wall biosynthesis